jgi:hypothetical protein
MEKHHLGKTTAQGKPKQEPLLEYNSWSVQCEFHAEVLMKVTTKQCMHIMAVCVISAKYVLRKTKI